MQVADVYVLYVYMCALELLIIRNVHVHMHVYMKLQTNHRSLAAVLALNQISIILSYV
jgi:hypothetical protein